MEILEPVYRLTGEHDKEKAVIENIIRQILAQLREH